MNRDIKFRAYRKDKGIMMYFDLDDIAYNGWSNYIFKDDGRTRKEIDLIRDENVILMQYIGLKDKNDKEIYEGDIVDVYNLHNNYLGKQIIAYDENAGCYEIKVLDHSDWVYTAIGWAMKAGYKIEVIGNRYENF